MRGCVHACVYIRPSIYLLQIAEKRREAKAQEKGKDIPN